MALFFLTSALRRTRGPAPVQAVEEAYAIGTSVAPPYRPKASMSGLCQSTHGGCTFPQRHEADERFPVRTELRQRRAPLG